MIARGLVSSSTLIKSPLQALPHLPVRSCDPLDTLQAILKVKSVELGCVSQPSDIALRANSAAAIVINNAEV